MRHFGPLHRHDLALVKVHASPPELQVPLALAKSVPDSGDHVLAAGHPGKEGEELGTDFNTLTGGVVVGQEDYQLEDNAHTLRCIAFEGKIRGGNSGGPLVNERGELCGLIVGSTQDEQQGLAVPPQYIEDFLRQAFEQVDRGDLTIPPAEVLMSFPGSPRPWAPSSRALSVPRCTWFPVDPPNTIKGPTTTSS